MKNRSKNNSVIFLTTLSVYLGLVLVGGAMPSVLAQAATTRNFNVQDELEVKDDLDNKPDENDLFASSIVKLIEELDKFSRAGKFDWQSKSEFQIEDFAFRKSDNSPSYLGSGTINRQVDNEIGKASIEIARKLLAKITNLNVGGKYDRGIDYKFSSEGELLSFQSSIKFDNEKNAQIFTNELGNYLASLISISRFTKEKIVAENTKISFQDNQVFIVTRLARGSLDELLKQDAKAESK